MGNYYLYLVAMSITRALPLRVTYALAVFLADIHYFFSKTDRRAVEANLKIVLNADRVASAMVRQVFRNFGKYLAEFLTMTKHFNHAFIRDHVRVSGSEHIDDVLKQGKGCIIVSAHLGNWEFPGALLSLLGYTLSVVALPHKDPKVNALFNDQRTFFGTTVIPTTIAIRRCVEYVKANRVVALLSERAFGANGMVMDFLGRPTMIPKGAAIFSIKTGAPIVTCFFLRKDNNDFEVRFGAPLYPPSVVGGKISDGELKIGIERYLRVIEEEIRQNPTQWLMFRKFWFS